MHLNNNNNNNGGYFGLLPYTIRKSHATYVSVKVYHEVQ